MIDLYIDGKRLDTDQQTDAAITLSIGSVEDPSQSLTAFSKSIEVPATARNKEIMQFADQLHGVEQFNNAKHPARLEAGGVVVMTGTAQITKVTVNNLLNASYEVNLIGAEYEWAKKATEAKLNETDGLGSWVFSAATIKSLLESTGGVYLFPVYRGQYVRRINDENTDKKSGTSGTFVPRPYTTLADYLPFFNVRLLMEKIIGQYGYSIRSDFFENNALFGRLVVAGEWEEYDTSKLEKKYDFLAGKFASGGPSFIVTNQRYEFGFNEIGRIVDTVRPEEESADEEVLEDVYDKGGCVTFPAVTEPVFTAKEDMVIGFEYNIEYVTGISTEYAAEGDKYGKLIWFDTVDGEAVPEECIEVDSTDISKNTPQGEYMYIYRLTKGTINDDKHYIRFRHNKDGEYDENGEYDETYVKIGQSGSFVCTVNVSSTAEVFIGEPNPIFPSRMVWKKTNMEIEMFALDNSATIKLKYIVEPRFLKAGEMMTIKTPVFSCSNAPNMADGKTPYIQLALTNNTTVKAYFCKRPGYGTALSAKNMLQSGITQMDFISAVKQMFDLMFYTNAETKEVYIEPRETFYTSTPIDWRGRMDYSQEIEIEDAGSDIGKTVVLGYQTDDAIERYNKKTGTELGTYKEDILKYHAEDEEDLTNPQFVATTVVEEKIPGAAAISLIDFSPEEDEPSDPWELDLDASMKVCEYLGMTDLPNGEDPDIPPQYLLIRDKGVNTAVGAFPEVSFDNLHFEGENGLKSYYAKTIESYNYGKRITAQVKLSPADVENLMLPNDLGRDFRALYCLSIGGEDVYCRLEEVNDYDPASAEPTECVFLKEN